MAKANLKGAVMPADLAVETLIDKGKKQGFLRPTDILACFPHVELDPDQLFRIFSVFGDMGIEVSDRENDAPEEVPKNLQVMGMGQAPTADPADDTVKANKTEDEQRWQSTLA